MDGTLLFNIKGSASMGKVYDAAGIGVLAPNGEMPTLFDSHLGGGDNRCYLFDSTHRLQLTFKSAVSVKSGDWSLGFWYKSYNLTSANDTTDWAFFLYNHSNFIITLNNFNSTNIGYPGIYNGVWNTPFNSNINDKEWHQIMLCYSLADNKTYHFFDGKMEGTINGSVLSSDFTKFDIGGGNYDRNYFIHGYTDDIFLLKGNCLHKTDFEVPAYYLTDQKNLCRVYEDSSNHTWAYK